MHKPVEFSLGIHYFDSTKTCVNVNIFLVICLFEPQSVLVNTHPNKLFVGLLVFDIQTW